MPHSAEKVAIESHICPGNSILQPDPCLHIGTGVRRTEDDVADPMPPAGTGVSSIS